MHAGRRADGQAATIPAPPTTPSATWHLDLPFWRHDGKPFQVTPGQVKADPVRYEEHYRRTLAADIGCPLDLTTRNHRWVILDGVHRLLKADLLGLSHVPVRRVPDTMLPLIRWRAMGGGPPSS